ncbi:TspO/MBR-related protein [Coprinopsis marcescibilis]|uniref:TspO/MBR-related protein n=1 Tax=Coprinopsis marcescibilis TaxID=230819 RepID=A0A5C3L9B2_COPMA|nr:TspO/MBR-related protein [Coprinopsis marcescibilis]
MAGIYIPNILLAIPRNPVTAVGLPLVVGFLSGSPPASKVANSHWYHDLNAPPGKPPREIFPYVWTLLYLSMGYASHVAVKAFDEAALLPHTRDDLNLGIALYYAQLGLNCVWSPIFFGTRNTGLALVDSVLLTATTCYMTKLLDRPTSGKATYFLLPYCGWLAYATYLNGGVWWFNGPGRKYHKRDDPKM